jgi:L-alanine-DL-glutamate epimerase-like enolase superfamily enzyme
MRHHGDMRISYVEAVPLDARLKTPFRFGHVVRTTSANVLVRITCDDGLVGYGEACPVPQLTAETQESVVALIEQRAAPELIGQDPLRWRPLLGRIATRLFQASFTQAAVDMALLDLAGKSLGMPVCELLGGRHRDAVEVHGSVGWDEDPECVAENAEQQAHEFRWLKLYAGTGTLADDLERIAAARRRIGDHHPFLLDVNGLWSPPEAITAGPVLRDLGVTCAEQPVAAADDPGQARVTAAYAERHAIAVIADERVRTPGDVHTAAAAGVAHCVNVGLSKMGGIVPAFDAAAAARAAQLAVSVGSVVELGVATAAGLQLAAALPEVSYPSYLIGPRKYVRQITWPDMQVIDSTLAIGTAPGLAVEVDEEAVAAMDLRRPGAVTT